MKKNLVIFSLVISVIAMAIGYINFSHVLGLENNKGKTGNWSVEIDSVSLIEKSSNTNELLLDYTNQTITFHVRFKEVGDYAKYKVSVVNSGTLDAKINNIIFVNGYNNDEIIKFDTEDIQVGTVIKAGEKVEFNVDVDYIKQAPTLPLERNEVIIIDFVQNK